VSAHASAAFVRYLIFPARGGAVLVLLVFAPPLAFAKLQGSLALPLIADSDVLVLQIRLHPVRRGRARRR
jgi:hypothetical protein